MLECRRARDFVKLNASVTKGRVQLSCEPISDFLLIAGLAQVQEDFVQENVSADREQ